jgi:hypothetical protein
MATDRMTAAVRQLTRQRFHLAQSVGEEARVDKTPALTPHH